ncbi:Glycosyltransferase involved in cell wall bisynthesis [Thalassovita litoralis]|uniref:Glycosyltransferase involved in cell wall bisynthesis n=1 Tax=Thalassovita litoralis TaxID=1010611 RepID=A0A521ENH3_9RHOB|nr:glycosyltransferase [Thalassovita litoralis]SMO85477.1 Glycosyltransferase involved in cell wall bisynthesis [Thalassovita litoralis]
MAKDGQKRPSVLLLADEFNPEWPSLPIVGFKYALEIAKHCDVVVATHVRNRENVEKARSGLHVIYIDNEVIAAPMYHMARLLRGGEEVGWSTSQMMNYLPYLAFERGVWKHFKRDLQNGRFDIVHRITPMTPTLPSYIAHKSPVPFVIGPLNGNLDWPAAFAAEQEREKEGLRRFRDFYKYLPYARSTYDNATCVLTAFSHTRADLTRVADDRIVMFPEIGFDPTIFNDTGSLPAGTRGGDKVRFMFAGRLVPYKLPELPLHAFAKSDLLRQHHLHILGDGPELPRMQAFIDQHGLADCVTLEGRKTQAQVAQWMRDCDVFVFPSIRELGAGVVIEAMASGQHLICVDYGAPGDLTGHGTRGDAVPMAPFDELARGFQAAMERAVTDRPRSTALAKSARDYAVNLFPWSVKGARTARIYDAILSDLPAQAFAYS